VDGGAVSDARVTQGRTRGSYAEVRGYARINAWRETVGVKVQLQDTPLLLAKLQLTDSAAHTRTPFFYISSSSL
jgi:hypothetical protein